MTQYINKSDLVAEIENIKSIEFNERNSSDAYARMALDMVKDSIDTLEVKDVDEQKERMSECPYRQVGCTMYEGKILECNGACSWVVDYPKLKELKAREGE